MTTKDCKACVARRSKGLEGLCPACANERARRAALSDDINNQADRKRTLLILFTYGSKSYRMRVAKLHVHPGEVDRVEVENRDMLGGTSWTEVPAPWQGTGPSAEWIIRRALWRVFSHGLALTNGELMTVDVGELA